MNEPTPRPWHNLGKTISEGAQPSQDWMKRIALAQFKEDADHIVKCVNLHEELVEQLRQAWACIEHIKEKSPSYEREASILQSLLVKAGVGE